MVTSAEFDEVLVPVDYQNNVLMRTFDTLIGFNKKNKKGKFMKAIKEEWVYDPITKKQIFRDRNAERKAFQEKVDKGAYKVVNLDATPSKPSVTNATKKVKTAAEKEEGKKLYSGSLVNKTGKTLNQIKKEADAKVSTSRAIRGTYEEPGDTHYTCKEIADYVYDHSAKARERYTSNVALREVLIKNEALRKKLDEKMIDKRGHKTDEEMRKSRATSPVKKEPKVELETDFNKIANWFWEKRNKESFKKFFPDATNYTKFTRMLQNDDRGLKFFAKIMRDNGYRKTADKPFQAKATLIKKGQAAVDFEKEGEAAFDWESVNDTLGPGIKRVKKGYTEACGGPEKADDAFARGINWAMEELFGKNWQKNY